MAKEHGKGGEFVETVTLEKVLEVFDDVRGPVVLSADVADRLDCSRQTARRKLEQLYDRGDLDRRKVSRRVIYWDPTPTAAPSPESAGTRAMETTSEGDTTDAVAAVSERLTADESLRASVREHLAGEGDVLERRVDAVLRMYAHLREHGTATKAEFLEAIDVDATGYQDAGSVWANMIKGKDTLRVLPGVHPPDPGKTTWTYREDSQA